MAVKTCDNCGTPVVTGHSYGDPATVPATKCPRCRAEARESGGSDVAGLPGVVATGGGWYELPGGERVHGRAKALEALARAADPEPLEELEAPAPLEAPTLDEPEELEES